MTTQDRDRVLSVKDVAQMCRVPLGWYLLGEAASRAVQPNGVALLGGQVGQVDIGNQVSEPGCIGNGKSPLAVKEGIFTNVPVLGIHIRFRGYSHIAHTS